METTFMKKLETQMEGLSQKTIDMYLTKLRKLNGDKPFKSLVFVKNVEAMRPKLESIPNDNTRKSYVASIIAVLGRQKDKASKKANDKYKEMFAKERGIFAEKQEKGEMSKTQKDNWIEMSDIKRIHKTLSENIDMIQDKDNLTTSDKRALEDHLLLSLYVLQPPRRNADYYMMKFGMSEDPKFNYVCLNEGKYKFNDFKTVKKTGATELPVPPEMLEAFKKYFELMKLKAGDYILFNNDEKRTMSNKITKNLNRITGKKVGSSMLRHIYLTEKYKDVKEQQKNDSEFMAHSVAMGNNYVLK